MSEYEALQWDGLNTYEMLVLVPGVMLKTHVVGQPQTLIVPNSNRQMYPGDWLIKPVEGEPFSLTPTEYEEVSK